MNAICAQNINVQYQNNSILHNLSLEIPKGRITALLGANGCGKSTLLKALANQLELAQGQITLNGTPIETLTRKEIAKQLAFLPQHPSAPETLTVSELVALGRYPYRNLFSINSSEDIQITQQALEATGLDELAERSLSQLSGGQRQRAWLAMILAQQAPIMMLDEPTSFLDIAHQYELLALVKRLNQEQHTTVIMVLHDISQAMHFSDHLVLLKEGQIITQGAPKEVITPESIKAAFNFNCRLYQADHPMPLLVPEGY